MEFQKTKKKKNQSKRSTETAILLNLIPFVHRV